MFCAADNINFKESMRDEKGTTHGTKMVMFQESTKMGKKDSNIPVIELCGKGVKLCGPKL